MTLNQNLYFSRAPTQRRNCHYIILFNNPIDRQLVTILVRQMYSGNIQYFMRNFDEAINKPYGYLLIDLKPTTDSNKRLLENALPRSTDYLKSNSINEVSTTQINHYSTEMSSCNNCHRNLSQAQHLCPMQTEEQAGCGLQAPVPQWYLREFNLERAYKKK